MTTNSTSSVSASPALSADAAKAVSNRACRIIMGPAKGMKEKVKTFCLSLTDEEVKIAEEAFFVQGPAIWRYWHVACKARASARDAAKVKVK